MPAWWTAAAHLEAEWRVSGRWQHGSLKDLARNFSADKEGAKSLASVTKMRADPRYGPMVAALVGALKMKSNRLPDEESRSALIRATMRAAYRKATEGEG
jgi:hypothetical protein